MQLSVGSVRCVVGLAFALAWVRSPQAAHADAWASQSADGSVVITTDRYLASVDTAHGTFRLHDTASGASMFQANFSVEGLAGTHRQSDLPATLTLGVDGDQAQVVVSQPATDLTLTSVYNFQRNTGRVVWEQIIDYQAQLRVLRERFTLFEPSVSVVDDSGSSYFPYAYIDNGKRQKKILPVNVQPSVATIRFFAGWREDDGDSKLDSTVLMVLNGRPYPINSWLTFPKTTAGPTAWVEVPVDPADLQLGDNEVVFQLSPRVGKEYFYLGLSTASYGRSAFSSDAGETWSTADLSPAAGSQPGEYMVQLHMNRTINWANLRVWDAARDQLATSARMTRYSPRYVHIPFVTSLPGLVVSGNDLGGEGIEEVTVTGAGVDAFIYRDTNNGYDAVISPYTGLPLDPEGYSTSRFNDVVRRAGETVRAKLSLDFPPALPQFVVTKSRWPRKYKAAWTLGDDTDAATVSTKRAAFYGIDDPKHPDYGRKGFVGHNLKVSVTTWWQNGPQGIAKPGDYRDLMLDLYRKGFEVGLHTATDEQDMRAVTQAAIDQFSGLFEFHTWLEHAPYLCQPWKGKQANLEDIQCYGAIPGSSQWYTLDILENSTIKYLCPGSVFMLTGCSEGSFGTPICLPHPCSYADDPGNPKQLLLAGRTGRAWNVSTDPARIERILSKRDLLVGYTHTAADGWLTADNRGITNAAEANLQFIQTKQDSGLLWVAPIYRIFDWMTAWEKVRIDSSSALDGWTHLDVTNYLAAPVRGLTLVANGAIAEAKIGGIHQIFVDGKQVVLPQLQPGESRHVEILPGEYRPDLPRLLSVDTDLDVLSAEYDSSYRRATITAGFCGFGLEADRRIAINCATWPSFVARDNGYKFLAVFRGRPPTSDPAYKVEYYEATGELRFVLPTTAGTRTVTIEPSPAAEVPAGGPDFDQDGDIDAIDLMFLIECATGPQIPLVNWACVPADLDADGDVDQVDFGSFQRQMATPQRTAP